MPGRLEFQFSTDAAVSASRKAIAQGPMRLLLLGDFSGHPAAERPALSVRPTHQVDIDRWDAVLERLSPQLAIGDDTVSFHSLDDFHPDQLYRRIAAFSALRTAQQQHPANADDDLLGRLLGKPSTPNPASAQQAATVAKTGLDALLEQIVTPHIVPDTSAQHRLHQTAVDSAATGYMRQVLHDPRFQALEAAWRGVHRLTQQLDLDEGGLELHLLDVSRTELLSDVIAAKGQIAQTALRHTLDKQLDTRLQHLRRPEPFS
jgi:type VI secretion system protein ImpC